MLEHLPYVAFERDAFIRTAEAAIQVQTRRELFVWLRLHLHRFVPHELALCQIHQSSAGSPSVHVFNSVMLESPLMSALCAPGAAFWAELRSAWLRTRRMACVVDLDHLTPGSETEGLRRAGMSDLLVHGVDAAARLRPEMLFVFGRPELRHNEASAAGLAFWLPHLHACASRVLDVEDLAMPSQAVRPQAGTGQLTARELQMLKAVREDKRTTEIAEQFGISALTVKNHMRKIMAKLGARSRAHAVAEAMARQLIS